MLQNPWHFSFACLHQPQLYWKLVKHFSSKEMLVVNCTRVCDRTSILQLNDGFYISLQSVQCPTMCVCECGCAWVCVGVWVRVCVSPMIRAQIWKPITGALSWSLGNHVQLKTFAPVDVENFYLKINFCFNWFIHFVMGCRKFHFLFKVKTRAR